MTKLLNTLMAASVALSGVGWINPLLADSAGNAPDREKALEQRINYLEERLRRVEGLLHSSSPRRSPPPAQATTGAGAQPTARQTPEVAENTPGRPATGNSGPASQKQEGSASPGVAAADDTPQELNILRENAVTLKPAGVEISNEVAYIQRQGNLQRDRGILSTTSIRYGVLDWLELSATIPFGYTTRVSDTSPGSAATRHVSGFGDLTVQANARLVEQTANWPGVVLSLGVVAPTGGNPYDLTHYRFNSLNGLSTPNPRNPLVDYYSQGSWGLHTNLQLYKTVDPVILFVGFGWDQVFPYTMAGFTIDGYTRLSYNAGFSLALSEKTTLGFSINGSYTPDLQVNGRDVFQSATEPTLARLTIIQRVTKDVYLEPSISFGLDQDAPDFVLGVGVRARF